MAPTAPDEESVPFVQPLLLSAGQGVQTETKELYQINAASAETRIWGSFEILRLQSFCFLNCSTI